MAQLYLNKAGIKAYKRVKKSDMERINKATGAQYVTDIEDLTADKLGSAGHVYVDKIFDHKLTFIEECENPKASSIVLRGSTRYVTEQISRALDDALGVVAATIEDGKVLIGGGACEIDLVKRLRAYGESVSGREQLAILAYANAHYDVEGSNKIDTLYGVKDLFKHEVISFHTSCDGINVKIHKFHGMKYIKLQSYKDENGIERFKDVIKIWE